MQERTQLCLVLLIMQDVAQGDIVQHLEKGLIGFRQLGAQPTCRRQGAFVRLAHALGDPETRLHRLNHFANGDLIWPSGKLYAAFLAPSRMQETFVDQLLHDLHQVILGDAVSLGNLGNRTQLARLQTSVNQDPQPIARKLCQTHTKLAPRARRHYKSAYSMPTT